MEPAQVRDSTNSRPADVPSNVNPQTTKDPHGQLTSRRSTRQPYSPAIDAQGNADCQIGQTGYLDGPVPGPNTPQPAATRPRPRRTSTRDSPTYLTDGFYQNQAGGSHVVAAPNTPGDAGSTYTGVANLRSVP